MAQKPITRDFGVTSPQTHHAEVEWIRNRLGKKDSNVFGIATFEGDMSGDSYGTSLADASYQMKFRVGYAEKDINPNYGQQLDRYLIGLDPLPNAMKERKAERKGITAPHSKYEDDSSIEQMRAEAVKRLVGKVGVREYAENQCFVTDWYGWPGAWCAMALCWAYDPLGCEATKRGEFWAYVPYIVADAKAGRRSLKVVTGDILKGDWLCMDWNWDGEHDHVGMATANAKRGAGIPTVEGNVDNAVVKRTRHVRQGEIRTVVRVLA